MTLFDLAGRVAVVTGGNRGLGLAMAQGLAAAGATAVIVGRDAVKSAAAVAEIRAGGGEALAFEADLASTEAVAGLFDWLDATTGRVDILVNNAGINRRHPPEDYPLDTWNEVMQVNLTSVFMCSQQAHRRMSRNGHGKIINIGSMTSILGAPLSPAYGASKGAIVALTRSLATAWAADNIQVNAILPGWIETELTRRQMQEMPALQARILGRTPARRWGVPEDLAGAAGFLASDAAGFVTGTTIVVDGGFSIMN